MMEVLNPSVTGYKRLHPNLAMASSASSSIPSDSRVGRIVKCTVRALLERDGYRQEQALSLIDPVGQLGEDESIIVERVVDLVLRLVDDPRQPRRITVDELEQNDWPLQPDNVHSEFKTVATQIFSDDIHWGRIVSFLSFSSTYILFAMRRGMPESIVQSVCGWTTNFMERELRSWFQTHSWEEFLSYGESILSARRRNGESERPGWQKLATIGAIGIGAAVLFSLRNSFS